MTTPNTGGLVATWGWLKAGPGAPVVLKLIKNRHGPQLSEVARKFVEKQARFLYLYGASPEKIRKMFGAGANALVDSGRVGPVTRNGFGELECTVDMPPVSRGGQAL